MNEMRENVLDNTMKCLNHLTMIISIQFMYSYLLKHNKEIIQFFKTF